MKKPLLSWCMLIISAFSSPAQSPVLSSYPSASAVIFLDFDGHTVEGTSWNWSLPAIACQASGLNATQITEIFSRVAEDFRPFNINITTDSTKFLAAPADQRMRVIITTTSAWYSNNAGGVAFIASFTWGDDHPCFVFSALLGHNAKKISEAASHEAGHTLGLYHQAQYDANCNKISDYHTGEGTGEIGWAPIMGVGYNRNFTLWSNGPNPFGCTDYQSDLEIITSNANGFGYRNDDHGNSFTDATPLLFTNKEFNIAGVIQQNTDNDVFRFSMPNRAHFKFNATPYNVGNGNAGSDLDMQISLYNASNVLLNVYNPGTLLNSVADTILNPGFYYLKVEGKGNIYAPAYASLGSYEIKANIEGGIPLPVRHVKLQALNIRNLQQFRWDIEADEKIVQQTLEVSSGGNAFEPLAEVLTEARSYSHNPNPANNNQYRLHVIFEGGQQYYSNIVFLPINEVVNRPIILGNIINSHIIYIQCSGNYQYAVLDLNGKTVSYGQLINGTNSINIPDMLPGMYLIRFNGNNQQWIDKLLRQ